jgi:hypothetical protein
MLIITCVLIKRIASKVQFYQTKKFLTTILEYTKLVNVLRGMGKSFKIGQD